MYGVEAAGKNEFNKLALSLSHAETLLCDKVGTEQGFLFRCLMIFHCMPHWNISCPAPS